LIFNLINIRNSKKGFWGFGEFSAHFNAELTQFSAEKLYAETPPAKIHNFPAGIFQNTLQKMISLPYFSYIFCHRLFFSFKAFLS